MIDVLYAARRLRWRGCVRGLFLLLAVSLCCGAAPRAAEVQPDRVAAIARWLPAHPQGFGAPISNRAAWEKLAALPEFKEIIASAQSLAGKPVPVLTDELYLDYSKTGNRTRCQKVLGARDGRANTLALAECLENRGRFIAPLAETVAAICAERTWVMPAHDGSLANFKGTAREMDLRATAVGWDLATIDFVLGDKLPPATRKLIRENVRSRVLAPFREMVEGKRKPVYWIAATHNWNAVCLAGVAGAALALEDSPAERAFYVAAAEHYIRNFLSGFTPDGYCSEGIGYWNYGFGRFLMLEEAVRQSTGGKLDLLADPAAAQPALYSTRTEIVNGLYPTIADCHPGSRPDAIFVRYIGERFGLKLAAGANANFRRPAGNLFATLMFAFLPEPLPAVARDTRTPAADSPFRTWFNNGGVLICRPAPDAEPKFAAVLKGGHNAEHHNHNDVGSFSVVLDRAMLICDPGAEVYTRRTFSSHRYDSKVLSSFGHAVPVVAGKLQQPGAEAKAVVLATDFRDDADTLKLDYRSAYPVPELKQLERTFTYRRGGAPSLTVRDQVVFSKPESFETALVTWGKWEKISDEEIRISDGGSAVRVKVDAGGRPLKFSSETLDEDVQTPSKPVRVGIALQSPAADAIVTLTITPEAAR